MQVLVCFFVSLLHALFFSPCNLFFCLCPSVSLLGGSLESVVSQDGCLSEDVVRRFGWDLVKGLKYMHELGIIFSDLTPAKVCICILICKTNSVKYHYLMNTITVFVSPLDLTGWQWNPEIW